MLMAEDRVLMVEHESIDAQMRSKTIHVPVLYSIQGKDFDCPFLGEVIHVGEPKRGQIAYCKSGDLVLCSLFHVHYRQRLFGLKVYISRLPELAGVLSAEDFSVKPIQDYVLVRGNHERAEKLVRGLDSRIALPSVHTTTDDLPEHSTIKTNWGEVVAVGEGQYQDGHMVKPSCGVGDMIMYDSSHSTVPLRIRGEMLELVRSSQIVVQVSKDDEQSLLDEAFRLKNKRAM